MVTGEVLIDNQPARGKIARFIEKKIHQWLETHPESKSEIEGEGDLAYRVALSSGDDEKQISCETEIAVGGATWRGWDLSTDTQQAFIHSLKRLQPH